MIQLFRVLLPSWRFFNHTIEAPVLYYRLLQGEGVVSDWVNCLPATGIRSWYQIFINPRELKYFASHALLEHFIELGEASVTHQTTLLLIRNLANDVIAQANIGSYELFQFKIEFSDPAQSRPEFVSDRYSIEPIEAIEAEASQK